MLRRPAPTTARRDPAPRARKAASLLAAVGAWAGCHPVVPLPEGDITDADACAVVSQRWSSTLTDLQGVARMGLTTLHFSIDRLDLGLEALEVDLDHGRADFALCVVGDVTVDEWDQALPLWELSERAGADFFEADDGSAPCYRFTAVLGGGGRFLQGSFWWEGQDGDYLGEHSEPVDGGLLRIGRIYDTAHLTLHEQTIPLLTFTESHRIDLDWAPGEGSWADPSGC